MGEQKLRLVQAGAGSMGRAWLSAIAADPDVELVGLVDLELETARRAAADTGHAGLRFGRSVIEVAEATDADAIVNVTVPAAHGPINIEALEHGLPVLCEKPMAESVAECLPMVDAAERTGNLLMISQSRRYSGHVSTLRALLDGLGRAETAHCEFVRAPHFGGFREVMAEPLLVDMAIHQFDLARVLLGSDPVSVYCESHNPTWSWYAGNAAASAIFEFDGGARFSFHGSWCGRDPETSWNGRWRIGAAAGGAVWDGDHAPTATTADGLPVTVPSVQAPDQIAGSLAEFVTAVRDGLVPDTVASRNVISVAMVEAAVQSSGQGRKVEIAEVMETARRQRGSHSAPSAPLSASTRTSGSP